MTEGCRQVGANSQRRFGADETDVINEFGKHRDGRVTDSLKLLPSDQATYCQDPLLPSERESGATTVSAAESASFLLPPPLFFFEAQEEEHRLGCSTRGEFLRNEFNTPCSL